MTDYNASTLIDGCRQLNLSLSDKQIAQFVRYYEMLTEKNKVMNLTAITEWEDVLKLHFLDSLLVCRAADLSVQSGPKKVLDLGSGAGFPGIPLKIAFPQLDLTLADSLNKRVLFLEEVIQELGFENIRAVHARAEELGHRPEHRQQYDLVVSRAVANLSSLCEYCIPFVKVGGQFIAYKSTDIDTEFNAAQSAIRILGGSSRPVLSLPLPETDVERSFVVIEKKKNTPDRYPRKAGTPSRDPLS